MTIADLKQYRSICAEIKDIESELDGSYAGDTVQSGSKFPYGKHTVRIEGYVPDGGVVSSLARLAELRRRKKEIEDYINGINDNLMRFILKNKFFKGKSNLWIAMKLGYSDESSVRKKIERFFKKV